MTVFLRGRALLSASVVAAGAVTTSRGAAPVARVAFSAIGFARQRDWLYVAIAAAVFLLLIVSLTGG